MVSILDEIMEKIKNSTFTVPFKDIREPYSTKQPVYPMITVEEITNTPQQQINGKSLELIYIIVLKFMGEIFLMKDN